MNGLNTGARSVRHQGLHGDFTPSLQSWYDTLTGSTRAESVRSQCLQPAELVRAAFPVENGRAMDMSTWPALSVAAALGSTWKPRRGKRP